MNRRYTMSQVGKSLLLSTLGIVLGMCVLLILDRVLGFYLNRIGYFVAMTPETTEIYDTNEFQFIATISAQGLRNPIVEDMKPEKAVRILVLGDSFSFGWGVDERQTWVRQVEGELKKEGLPVEFINAAMPGADPTEKRHICRAYADRFAVDAIILGVYADDFYQTYAREERQVGLWSQVETALPTISRVKHPVIGAYRFENVQRGDTINVSEAWRKVIASSLRSYQLILPKLSAKIRSDFLNGKINVGIITRSLNDPDFLTFLLESDGLNYALKSLDIRFQRFKDRCVRSLPVLVVFIPDQSMVSEKYASYSAELGYKTSPKLLTLDLDTPLSQLASRHGFHYVSMDSDVRSDGCEGCYFPYDQHLTSMGHARVAKTMLPSVRTLVRQITGSQP